VAVVVLLAPLALDACGKDDPGVAPRPSPTPSVTTPAMQILPPSSVPTTSSPPSASPTALPSQGRATSPWPSVPIGLLGQDVERIPTGRRLVALTFDAGANADALPSILATLAVERVTATFFLTGDFVRSFPSAARSIVAAGHRLGNHSVSHPRFTSLTDDEIRGQVLDAAEAIRTVAGVNPQPLFRFPFGDRDARTIAAVNDLGYVAVRWTVDSLGWQGVTGGRTANDVTRRVLGNAQPGQIVLMHVGSHPSDGSMLDAQALPDVIVGLRQAGYELVTLDALSTAATG